MPAKLWQSDTCWPDSGSRTQDIQFSVAVSAAENRLQIPSPCLDAGRTVGSKWLAPTAGESRAATDKAGILPRGPLPR